MDRAPKAADARGAVPKYVIEDYDPGNGDKDSKRADTGAGANTKSVKPESSKTLRNGSLEVTSAIFGEGGQKVGFAETEEGDRSVIMRVVMIEDEADRGKGYALNAYKDTIDYAISKDKEFHSDKAVSKSARKVYDRLKSMGYTVEQSPTATEDSYGRLHSSDKGPVFRVSGGPMRKSILFFRFI